MEIPIPELISATTAIVATSVAFVKLLFKKLETFETKFSATISLLTDKIIDIDKRLAINTIIVEKIDQFIEERHYYGRNHGNSKTY